MTLKSGMAGQLGIGEESPWGVPVTPTIWLPFLNESLSDDRGRNESESILAGRRTLDANQSSDGLSKVGGSLGLELHDRSTSLLFKHMMGGVSTGAAVGGIYPHTYTPGDLAGLGLTAQVGRPGTSAGTVNPNTYSGLKVASWELGIKAGEIVTLGLDLAGRHEIGYRTVADGVTTSGQKDITSATAVFSQSDVGKPISGTGIPAASTIESVQSATAARLSANATATGTGVTFTLGIALASPSFTSGISPVTAVVPGGTAVAMLTLGGNAYRFNELTLSGDNGLGLDREFAGDQARAEPLEVGRRAYTGSIKSEFFDPTMQRLFQQGATGTMVVSIGKGSSTLVATANIRYDGSTPNIDGPAALQQEIPFTCLSTPGGTDASALTLVVNNTDATP